MRILINGLLVFRSGGHYTYFKNFIPQLGRLGMEHEFILLHASWQDALNFSLPMNFTRILAGPPKWSPMQRIMWEQMKLPDLLRQREIDVLFSPEASIGFSFPCPTVVAVRNLNVFEPLQNTGIRYFARNSLLRIITRVVTKRAAYVIFVSEYSRKAALKVLNLDPTRAKVLYHGVGTQFSEAFDQSNPQLEALDRPYILTISTIQTHKNYPRLLEAFGKLCRAPGFSYDLVFAGPVGAKDEYACIQEMMSQPPLKGRVHYLGEVSYEELPALYQGASLYVNPSQLEAFGHTLVEAMAVGVPIVASNKASIPEIAGDAALYFDPANVEDIADKISTVLNDPVKADQLVQAGRERVKQFSWERTAQQMLDLFELAYHSRN